MSNSSPELVWSIVRRNSRFAVKGRTRVGAEFNSEPGNLRNRNSFRYSTLTGKTLAVTVDAKGNAVVTGRANGAPVKVDAKGNRKKAFAAISTAATTARRGDLKRDALARYNALHRAQQRGATSKKARK